MYDEYKKYLIPKMNYYMMMSDLKMASEDPHIKVRQQNPLNVLSISVKNARRRERDLK